MKQLSVIMIFFLACVMSLSAQIKEVQLDIHHLLKNQAFEFNKSSENNLNHKFLFTRVQYYISEIAIVHDNGQETKIEDLWVLVDASDQTTRINLGSHAINTIEAVSFFIGVDPDHNHLDPTIWPSDHPLAPHSPSMHWGWAPGYRFVALEGFGGDMANQLFQLHGLGDENYVQTIVAVNSSVQGNIELLEINADYTAALSNIELNQGMIVHAVDAEARLSINNFNKLVFNPTNSTSAVEALYDESKIKMYPNPINQGILNIELEGHNNIRYQITSNSGELIKSSRLDAQQINVSNLPGGMYFISLYENSILLVNKRLVIQ